jgi:hypothetical protein
MNNLRMNNKSFYAKAWASVNLLVVFILLFVVTFSIAINGEQEDELGIDVCVVDIFRSSSKASLKVSENGGIIHAYTHLGGDRYRHCFFLEAYLIESVTMNNGTTVNTRRPVNSIGYGSETISIPEPPYWGWKTTTYPEDVAELSRSNISCKRIVSWNNLDRSYLDKAGGDFNLGIGFQWANLTTLLERKAKEVAYHLFSSNCCSAAQDVCNAVAGEEVCKEIEDVNFGIGTRVKGVFGASSVISKNSVESSENWVRAFWD